MADSPRLKNHQFLDTPQMKSMVFSWLKPKRSRLNHVESPLSMAKKNSG